MGSMAADGDEPNAIEFQPEGELLLMFAEEADPELIFALGSWRA